MGPESVDELEYIPAALLARNAFYRLLHISCPELIVFDSLYFISSFSERCPEPEADVFGKS